MHQHCPLTGLRLWCQPFRWQSYGKLQRTYRNGITSTYTIFFCRT